MHMLVHSREQVLVRSVGTQTEVRPNKLVEVPLLMDQKSQEFKGDEVQHELSNDKNKKKLIKEEPKQVLLKGRPDRFSQAPWRSAQRSE